MLIPKIAKIVQKNRTKAKTFVSCVIEVSNVLTIDRMEGKTDKERSGRKSRNVRNAETLSRATKARSPVITTMKSSQFQASRKYVCFSRIMPIAIIFKMHSIVNATVKNGSIDSRILFLGFSVSL